MVTNDDKCFCDHCEKEIMLWKDRVCIEEWPRHYCNRQCLNDHLDEVAMDAVDLEDRYCELM